VQKPVENGDLLRTELEKSSVYGHFSQAKVHHPSRILTD
jgi:hypothetical protein